MNRILVVEDDKEIAKLLRYNLEREGYSFTLAVNGEEGLTLARKLKPDLIIVDVMLPKLSGLDLCKILRPETDAAILILSAKKDELDRVLGLELGADDYVTKPFSVRELLARVKILLKRRRAEPKSRVVVAGDLEIDLERFQVRLKGREVHLSSKEFSFLQKLIECEGKALSREQILELAWGVDQAAELDTRTIDQHVARIRAKLGSEAARLVTIKNVGYRFRLD